MRLVDGGSPENVMGYSTELLGTAKIESQATESESVRQVASKSICAHSGLVTSTVAGLSQGTDESSRVYSKYGVSGAKPSSSVLVVSRFMIVEKLSDISSHH